MPQARWGNMPDEINWIDRLHFPLLIAGFVAGLVLFLLDWAIFIFAFFKDWPVLGVIWMSLTCLLAINSISVLLHLRRD